MQQLEELSKVLRKRGYESEVFSSGSLVSEKVCKMVKGHTIGFSNSMTIRRLGLPDSVKNYAKRFFTHIPGRGGEEERRALTADYYLTSANAISMDGHIVNIDGTGNRVAATCFGPGEVIYLIGKNKITETLDEATKRAKWVAVKLAQYYHRNTPCAITGKCEDCLSADCICSITSIHRKKPYGTDISIFLINEELGL